MKKDEILEKLDKLYDILTTIDIPPEDWEIIEHLLREIEKDVKEIKE